MGDCSLLWKAMQHQPEFFRERDEAKKNIQKEKEKKEGCIEMQ